MPGRDLGEASAINDASARLGAVLAVAAVPTLVGATGGDLGGALSHGYQPAMLILAGACAVAALITMRFVSDAQTPALKLRAPAPHHGCVLPAAATPVPSTPAVGRAGQTDPSEER